MYVLSNISNTHKACYAMRQAFTARMQSPILDSQQQVTREDVAVLTFVTTCESRSLSGGCHTNYVPEPIGNLFLWGIGVRHITPSHQCLYQVSLPAGVTPSQSFIPFQDLVFVMVADRVAIGHAPVAVNCS
jgi:hypothetical protein